MLWRTVAVCLVMASIAMAPITYAKKLRTINDKDGNAVPWQEANTELPAYPQTEDLVQVQSPPGARKNRYFVDTKSLSLGPDLVLRYTVVIVPPGGANNVFFQGIACETNEVKTYAYGRVNGTFVAQPNAVWRAAKRTGTMGYQNELIGKYICDGGSSPIGPDDVRLRLREGGQPYDPVWTDDGAAQ
jgi:hypothetical protein